MFTYVAGCVRLFPAVCSEIATGQLSGSFQGHFDEKYNQIAGKGAQLGLVGAKQAKIETYVTQKTLDGLFLMIAEQEESDQ